MNEFDVQIRTYLDSARIQAEHLIFEQSCHSVDEAARAVGAAREDLVKNICFTDGAGLFVVAIVKGEDRVSRENIESVLGKFNLRLATPEEILSYTGYPCGGTPSFGYPATFLIDPRVMEKEVVYSGGGSEQSLIRISPSELQRANHGQIVRIRR